MYQFLSIDVSLRTNSNQPIRHPNFYQMNVTEIGPGIIFREDGLNVEAFLVKHGDVKPAFGYKITTEDKSIVISGDTSPSDVLAEKAKGVDPLFHEVISDKGLQSLPKVWQNYMLRSHSKASDVGKIAARAKPGKLILYHALFYAAPEQSVVKEASKYFSGEIILAEDLDQF